MNLYGEILDEPQLRFDYSSESAVDTSARRGLSRFGPYDSNLFPKDKISTIVLFPKGRELAKQALVAGLQQGEGRFSGFESYFKVPVVIEGEVVFDATKPIDIDSVVNDITLRDPDLVYVILENRFTNIYAQIKSRLLANGIPSQMATAERLADARGREYMIENISLASYAKIGGSPWTVSAKGVDNNLILGVSRAEDVSSKYLVGYVSLFTKDGDFLFMNSGAPVIEWNSYISGLAELVAGALTEFEKEFEQVKGTPASIVVHFCKNPGKKELEAIETGIKSVGKDLPYAIVHLNEYSNFRLFDASQTTYIPQKGLAVRLSEHEALLMLDGTVRGRRRKAGVPKVLDVRMDKRSTLEIEKFPSLVKQVHDFANINWRGFNAAAIPITLNYSKLISRMVVELGIASWNALISEGRLRDKAWFL